jgi:hypothetical protein
LLLGYKLARGAAAPYHSRPMDHAAFFAPRYPALVLALLAGSALFGCAGSESLKKEVKGFETQLTAMRADQDRLEERLAALELSTQSARAEPSAAVERVQRPRLKVIHLSPDDEAPAATSPEPSSTPNAADSARRPVIRGTGDRVIKVGDGESGESTSKESDGTKPVARR